MKHIEKILGLGMLVFAIGFNLWLYRLEPQATIDPNDNAFQFGLVDRTNQVWDFAHKSCTSQKQDESKVKKLLVLPVSLLTCFAPYLVDHWVPNWAEGYNLPFYYSHVPQIVIVGSWRLFNILSNFILQKALQQDISLFQYYHWIIYLLLSLFPLSMFVALRVIKLPWLAAGIGALLASHLSTDGLYGLDPPSFLWRGYGLSSQLFAMIWMPLGIAYSSRYFATNPKHQTLNPKQAPISNVQNSKRFGALGFWIWNLFSPPASLDAKHLRAGIWNLEFRISPAFWPAVIFLTMTAMGHLGLGMIAMLSLVPLTFSKPLMMILQKEHLWDVYEITKNELTKLLILAGTVIFFLSYWVIPIVLGDNYHNISFWDPPWKFASYGTKETITRLLNGDLFDWGRGPWMTVLVMVGLIAAVWPKHELRSKNYELRENNAFVIHNSYFALPLLFVFWLLLYFGRGTWGPLIDLIPGIKEFHLSRFIVGVHIAGLFLMPIGLWTIIERFRFPHHIVRYLCYLGILGLVIPPIYKQTISYSTHNDRLIKQANENHANVKADEEALFAAIRALAPGRVFAGRGGWWGKNFKVAETPYYMNLSTYGIPTVLWLPETWSPNSDVEQYFSEDQAKDYDLFGIRYVAAPPKQEAQKFWKLIDERETWKLYEVTQSVIPASEPGSSIQKDWIPGQARNDNNIGYFTTGMRPAIVATDKRSYGNVVRLWIQSDAHVKGLFPELTFVKDYPRTTGLPNFKMLDEVTYVVPDGSTHNLFKEPPWYQNTTNTTNHQILPIIKSETNNADMIFTTKIEVPGNCTECIVILKQTFHPNWRATIDGKSVDTFTVFPFYLAVHVPEGTHEVVFSYEPSRLKIALLVIELTTILVLFILRAKKRFN